MARTKEQVRKGQREAMDRLRTKRRMAAWRRFFGHITAVAEDQPGWATDRYETPVRLGRR